MTTSLIGPPSGLGYPAPFWFLVLFKTLGFTLHMLPMHLFYAGLPAMLLLRRSRDEHAVRLSDRVLVAMPVIVAWGVNLGIVPLLFTQVAWHQVFYPATILMAWPWFSVFVLLTIAYYGVYIYALGLRGGSLLPWRRAAGWVAAVLLLLIGLVFANAFSLMTNVVAWRELWRTTSVAGAPLGTALNLGDPTLWPRWLMMLGLALTTTGAYVAFDTAVFASGESRVYRRWALRRAVGLHALGTVWFAVCGAWYVFGTLAPAVRARLLAGPHVAPTMLTALAPGVVGLLLVAAARRAGRAAGPGADGAAWPVGRSAGVTIMVAQFVVLALNAGSRQIVQGAELAPYLDLASGPVNMQTGPLFLFLLLFVAGLGVVIWMLRQAVKAARGGA